MCRPPGEACNPQPTPIDPKVLAQLPEAMQRKLLASLPSHHLGPSCLLPAHPSGAAAPSQTLEGSAGAWKPAPGLQETKEIWASLHAAFESLASTAQPRKWHKRQDRLSSGSDAARRSNSPSEVDFGQVKAQALCELVVEWGRSLAGDNLEGLAFLLRRLKVCLQSSQQFQAQTQAAIDQLQDVVQQMYGAPIALA